MSFFPRLCLLVLLFALPDAGAHAQSAPFTLYLAGDGGAATSVDGTPALAMLRDSLTACEASCGVLFLGDNVYTSGLAPRSEEHTSELQSRGHLVCRLLLEKKKVKN